MIELPAPYVLYLGDPSASAYAKTAIGLKDWAPEKCLSEYACGESSFTIGLPRLSLPDAAAQGARSLVIGVATAGGAIRPEWMPYLIEALEAGLDLVSGMHNRLNDQPELKRYRQPAWPQLIDVRVPPANIPIGTGIKRSRQAPADRRHRLRARQEIHRARARPRLSPHAAATAISARRARPAS
jgi:hypothetical protein